MIDDNNPFNDGVVENDFDVVLIMSMMLSIIELMF